MNTLAGGQDWTDARERSNLLALRTIAWIAVHLGRPAARALLHPIVAYFLLFAPRVRRHSRRFLTRALGRKARLGDIYRHLHAFASVALDRIWFARGDMRPFELQVRGGPLVDEVLAEGRGAFLIGAHVGSFEALHAVGATRPGMRVAMVMYPENARKVQQVLHALAPDSALDVIAIGHARSALAVRDWLETGGLTGLLGDRFTAVDGAHAGSVEREFLGQPARFTDGPLRLALLLKRPVLFMVALYRGGRCYEVRFERLADFRLPPADAAAREALLQSAISEYVQRLQALCVESPWNWFNFFDFWGEDARR